MKFSNWLKNEPNNKIRDRCVILNKSQFKWKTTGCSNKYSYICERRDRKYISFNYSCDFEYFFY